MMAANYQTLSSASEHLNLDMRHDDHNLTEAAIDMMDLHPSHEYHGPHSDAPSEHSGMSSCLRATKQAYPDNISQKINPIAMNRRLNLHFSTYKNNHRLT